MNASRSRQVGFTLFELAVVFVLVSATGAVLLERMASYRELAEKSAMESTVRLVKTGLQIRLAELIVANRQRDANELEREDPTRWLDTRPANYAGEYRDPPRPGKWYYDGARRELVYVVASGFRLTRDDGHAGRELRFKARLLKDRLTIGDTRVDNVTGVTVVPVTPYHWSRRRDDISLA